MRTTIMLAAIIALGACEKEQQDRPPSENPERGANVSTDSDGAAVVSRDPEDEEAIRADGSPQTIPGDGRDAEGGNGSTNPEPGNPSGDFGPNYPRLWEAEESERKRAKESE